MNAEDKLRQAKAEYDKYLDALLANLTCSEREWGHNVVLGRRSATSWAETLREVSPQMDYTLQLDKAAEEVLPRFNHLLHFIVEYRMRHLGEDGGDAAGVLAPVRVPPQSGSSAKPLA